MLQPEKSSLPANQHCILNILNEHLTQEDSNLAFAISSSVQLIVTLKLLQSKLHCTCSLLILKSTSSLF